MSKKNEKGFSVEDASYTAFGTGIISLVKFLAKKKKKESVNPFLKNLIIKKINAADLEALKLNGQNIKVLKRGTIATGKGSGKKQNNVFAIPIKQFGKKEGGLLGIKPHRLIKSSTRGSSNLNYLESSTSLTLTTKQNNYNPRKVGKRSFRSVSSSSNRTLTIECKKSSKLLIPKSTYNKILMNSIPSKIIDSNIENPVFVPMRSIWKRNSSDSNNENKPRANSVLVRSIKENNRKVYSNLKNAELVPEGSIGERKSQANGPSEPKNYIRLELLRDLESKTKVIPDLMEKVKSIEDQLSTISTKKIKEFDFPNQSTPKSTRLGTSPNCPHVPKSKVHMASKRNKRTKGNRHKIRQQSASLSRQNGFNSESCKDLNFVFEPKCREFNSSTFSAPTQTIISCRKSVENDTTPPAQDTKINQIVSSQADCEDSVCPWQGAAFPDVLSGKDMMELFKHLQNNFSLPFDSGELYVVNESQNLQKVEKSLATKSSSVVEKNQVNDEMMGNLNEASPKSVGCENLKESPKTSKVLSKEEMFCNDQSSSKNKTSDPVKPDTGCEYQQLPEPQTKNNNIKENVFEWFKGCTKNEKSSELSITVQLKDGNKSVTFESSAPKILELPLSEKSAEKNNSLADNYVNRVGMSKVQPISTRSIFTSPKNYHECDKEEAMLTSMESLIAVKNVEFDSAGEGDVPCPITKARVRNFDEDGSSVYLGRKKREALEDELRLKKSRSNMCSPYPKTTLAHFMTNDVVDDSVTQRNTLTFNNCDCDSTINYESGTVAPICNVSVDEDCDIKYTNNVTTEDRLNMNRYSNVYTFTEDSDKDQKTSKVQFHRQFIKLESIQEASEPDSENDQLPMVYNTDEETGTNNISTKSSVSVQTDLELIDISFDWALQLYRLASVINLNNKPDLEDQTELMRHVTESASVSKCDVDIIDVPKFSEASSEFNIIEPISLNMSRTLSKSHVFNEYPDEGKNLKIDPRVHLKKYEMSKLDDIDESEEDYPNSFEPLDLLRITSDVPNCKMKESIMFLSGEVPNVNNMLLNGGEPHKEAENNQYTDKKDKKKSQKTSIKIEKLAKHVCSERCFCPTTDDDEVLNSDLDVKRDYCLFRDLAWF